MKLGICALAAMFLVPPVFAFQAFPFTKDTLWKVLKDGTLPPEILTPQIQERGVDFELAAEDEDQLRSWKVPESVIASIRDHGPAKLPEGPPLTENQVLLLLEAPIPSRTLSRLVEKRKAAFSVTREVGQRLTAAGARPGLIGTLTLNQVEPEPAPLAPEPQPPPPPAVAPPPDQPAVAAPPSGPVPVPADEQIRRLLSSVPPVYPSLARQARVEGKVVVEMVVDANGVVKSARAIRGPAMLRQAAVDAVRQFRYEPLFSDGQPVEVLSEAVISFTFRQ